MEIQHLLKLIEHDQYVYRFRRVNTQDVVKNIMCCHSNSIKLLNDFQLCCFVILLIRQIHIVFHCWRLLVCLQQKWFFSVAFSYLQSKKTNNFEWVFNKAKCLFLNDDVLPWVIVTNKDLPLMNALEVVFSSSTNLLCEFHIFKNVRGKCKILVTKVENWEGMMDAWWIILMNKYMSNNS